MAIWVASYLQNKGKQVGWYTSPSQDLIDHFKALNIEITDEELAAVFADGGVFDTLINELEDKLVTAKLFSKKSEINMLTLAAEQWAKGNLLNDESTNL